MSHNFEVGHLEKVVENLEREVDRLRDIEVTYEQIRRIAQMQSYDEYNNLEDAWEFANDLWKSEIFDILHPVALTQA